MLHKRHELYASALVATDLLAACAAWLLAYWLRFHYPQVSEFLDQRGWTTAPYPFAEHLKALPIVAAATVFCYRGFGLYRPHRTQSSVVEGYDILRASVAVFLIVVAAMVFLFHENYARMVLAPYFVLVTTSTIAIRALVRAIARRVREGGRNTRRVLVVGAGALGQDVARRLTANRWMGLVPVGFVDDDAAPGASVLGLPVVGGSSDVITAVHAQRVDQVFVAIPYDQPTRLRDVLDVLTEAVVDVHIVPDLLGFAALNASAGDLDGIPLINLRESPLQGWNQVFKRGVDIAFSAGLLLVFSPLMALVAAAVRYESPGPVFYGQERMGLDGRTFKMYKFRSMKIDAENGSGAVWCKKEDDRRTRVGTFIRATSLDELPQFWNVLRGDMSLVGPRPERPVFIDQFKRTVPKYMLRHKIQAGITGWAQINGWRGNTSLEKRIQFDLYYIENWSLWFDIRIMLLTPLKGFINTNAY